MNFAPPTEAEHARGWLIRLVAGGCPLALLLLLCLRAGASAQEPPRDGWAEAPPEIEATRATGPITLDGRLTEEAWAAATPATRFTQTEPVEGTPVSQPTEVRILFDDEALYVGARLYDDQPVSSRLGRRDAFIPGSDHFTVALDSYRDFRTAYQFRVNPAGVRSDEILTGGNAGWGDDSWDPVWQAETTVTDSGWVAEMRIPFGQLRFRPADLQRWGIQIERDIARRQEEAVFAFTPSGQPGGIARFGVLTGLRGISTGSPLEILPYAVARAEYLQVPQNPEAPFADPFQDGSEYGMTVGADIKYRLTSNLTIDATVNPDFGQVEADPAEINLSAVESRFDERRPFFVEGSDIFEFGSGGMQMFYTRRVGRPPQVDGIDSALYRDVPPASTILGAAKLTGKTAGWSLGVLEAITGRETAPYVDGTGEIRDAAVEPRSSYFVGRARREMREGQTLIGGIVTAANRDLSDTRIRGALRSASYAAGADFRHEWADRRWAAEGHIVGSHIRGERGVILDAQTSPARYYQRPDALYLDLDSAATSLSGYTARLELGKRAGGHWRGGVSAAATSPGYEINDLGFYYDGDRVSLDSRLEYVEERPGPIFRDWRIHGGPGADWNFGGDYLGTYAWARASGELLNYWSGDVRVSRGFAGLSDRLTRGGPLARGVSSNGVSFELRSDRSKAIFAEIEADYDWDVAGGWSRDLEFDVVWRPASNWTVSLGPEWSRRRSIAQYVATVEDAQAASTFGNRYIFAELNRSIVSLRARLSVIFSPDLTLEMYAEPFLGSGEYGPPKELASPRSFDFIRYGVDRGTLEAVGDEEFRVDPDGDGPAESFTVRDRDFRTGSLRGNAVLRWQWRPGSTLFVVWQQERASYEPIGQFRLGPGLGDLWAERPDNRLLFKVSYWINR